MYSLTVPPPQDILLSVRSMHRPPNQLGKTGNVWPLWIYIEIIYINISFAKYDEKKNGTRNGIGIILWECSPSTINIIGGIGYSIIVWDGTVSGRERERRRGGYACARRAVRARERTKAAAYYIKRMYEKYFAPNGLYSGGRPLHIYAFWLNAVTQIFAVLHFRLEKK